MTNERLKEKIEIFIPQYRDHCLQFLKDIIAIPSESGEEGAVAKRVHKEMIKNNFDDCFIDDFGNVVGKIGNGPTKIVYDGHIDIVGVGDKDGWKQDPFHSWEEDGFLYGRGASDNKQSVATLVYGARLFKELCKSVQADLLDKFSIYVTGSVMEEDCDGLGLGYVLKNVIKDATFVCVAEATNLAVHIGHRGRMEINVVAKGRSAHASEPERGDNAIYRMTPLIKDIGVLNKKLEAQGLLGKGSISVTHISCETPSVCAIPNSCRIHIDRRLSTGEDKKLVIDQIKALPSFEPGSMTIEVLNYDKPSYTGKKITAEKYYPTWILDRQNHLFHASLDVARFVLDKEPEVRFWKGSTNGVSSMGELGIPTIGFGAGYEEDAHTTNDRVKIKDIEKAIIYYSALPFFL